MSAYRGPVGEMTGVGERISPGVYLWKDRWITEIVIIPDELPSYVRDTRPVCPACGTVDAMTADPFTRRARCVCGHVATAETLATQRPRWIERGT